MLNANKYLKYAKYSSDLLKSRINHQRVRGRPFRDVSGGGRVEVVNESGLISLSPYLTEHLLRHNMIQDTVNRKS